MSESHVLGFLEVRIPKDNDPVRFLKKLRTLFKNWHFGITFTEDINNVRPKSYFDVYVARVDFEAVGMESFQNNLERFAHWLQDTGTKEEAEAIAWLEDKRFHLMFEYVEDNREKNFIGEGSAYFKHQENTPIGAMKMTSKGYHEVEYNYKNLVQVMDYTAEQAMKLTEAA